MSTLLRTTNRLRAHEELILFGGMPEEELDLWKSFLSSRENGLREKLILLYQPLVREIVGKVKKSVPHHVDYDDLFSWGNLGLIRSVDSYQLNQGTTFHTYARYAVYGDIMDGLRAVDHISRDRRNYVNQYKRLEHQLMLSLQRKPTTIEVLAYLVGEMRPEHIQEILSLSDDLPQSLDNTVYVDEGKTCAHVDILTSDTRRPPRHAPSSLRRYPIAAQLLDQSNLTGQEKQVINLVYGFGEKMRYVSGILGVGESRVSQLVKSGFAKIRAMHPEIEGMVRGPELHKKHNPLDLQTLEKVKEAVQQETIVMTEKVKRKYTRRVEENGNPLPRKKPGPKPKVSKEEMDTVTDSPAAAAPTQRTKKKSAGTDRLRSRERGIRFLVGWALSEAFSLGRSSKSFDDLTALIDKYENMANDMFSMFEESDGDGGVH